MNANHHIFSLDGFEIIVFSKRVLLIYAPEMQLKTENKS